MSSKNTSPPEDDSELPIIKTDSVSNLSQIVNFTVDVQTFNL